MLCRIAKVSRAGYYKRQRRIEFFTSREVQEQQLIGLVKDIHNKRKSLGYRRIADKILKTTGWKVSGKRILRIMQKLKIRAAIRKKRFSNPGEYLIIPNIINRNFKVTQPFEKVVSDVTCFYRPDKSLYMSVFLDLYNNEILEYELSPVCDLPLVITPLKRLLDKRKSDVQRDKTVFHSDQGFHYASNSYNYQLKQFGITQSMSRRGTPLDNAPNESFFGLFKDELEADFNPSSFEELVNIVKQQVIYYNNDRPQMRLNYLTPIEYRERTTHI